MKDPIAEFQAARRVMAENAIAISDLILDAAAQKIDALFGAGFAQANPALVGQYLDATTRTFQYDMESVAEFDDLDFDPPPPDSRRRR